MASFDNCDELCLRFSCLMLRIAPQAVRIYFNREFHPNKLKDTLIRNIVNLTSLKTKGIIRYPSWKLLFPSDGSEVTSDKFDLPLMMCLLRNLAAININKSVLSCIGNKNDKSYSLSTIKFYYDDVVHSDLGGMTVERYKSMWNDAKQAIGKLGGLTVIYQCVHLEKARLTSQTKSSTLSSGLGLNALDRQMATNYLRLISLFTIVVPEAVKISFNKCFNNKSIQEVIRDNLEEISCQYNERKLAVATYRKLMDLSIGPPTTVSYGSSKMEWGLQLSLLLCLPSSSFSNKSELNDIKQYHTEIYHLTDGLCSEEDFEKYWTPVSQAVKNLSGIDCERWKCIVFEDANAEDTVNTSNLNWETHEKTAKTVKRMALKRDIMPGTSKAAIEESTKENTEQEFDIWTAFKGSKRKGDDKSEGWTLQKKRKPEKTTDIKSTTTQNVAGISRPQNANASADYVVQGGKDYVTWFYRMNIVCSGHNIDCILPNTVENKYGFLSDKYAWKTMSGASLKMIKDNISPKKEDNITEFEEIYLIHIKDRQVMSNTDLDQLLSSAVKRTRTLLCRYLLQKYNEYNLNTLGDLMIFLVNEKKNVETVKALGWHISREYLKRNRTFMKNGCTVWLGTECFCTKNQNYSNFPCWSSMPVIVLETTKELDTSKLEMRFCNFDVKIIKLDSGHTSEAKAVSMEHSKRFTGRINCKGKIKSHTANLLFDKHSNLTVVCPSAIKSKDFKSIHQMEVTDCIQMCCSVKGIVPVGEMHFCTNINGIQTDVLQAIPILSTGIKIGNKVGPKQKYGTIGGFVKFYGHETLLTCAHVVFDPELLFNEDKKKLHEQQPHTVYSHGANQVEWKVLQHYFRHDNPDEVSIDAALVLVENPSNISGYHIAEGHSYSTLGMKSPYLNDSYIDIPENFDATDIQCTSFGATTGSQQKSSIVTPIKGVEIFISSTDQPAYQCSKIPFPVPVDLNQSQQPQNIQPSSVFSSFPLLYIPEVHIRAYLEHLEKEGYINRTKVKMFKQCSVLNYKFQPGDSGSCIYVTQTGSPNQSGCIGMAIANFPNGCIATPINAILRSFRLI